MALQPYDVAVVRHPGIAGKEIAREINGIETLLRAKVTDLKEIQTLAGVPADWQ